MRFILTILLSCILLFFTQAQSNKNRVLAQQYYKNKDYEKAANLFYDLWKNDKSNNYYYTSLLYSYLQLKEFENAEKIVKKQLKTFKSNLNYNIDLGYVYSQNNQINAAEKEFDDVIKNLSPNQNDIRRIANKFLTIRQNDYAIKTYEQGRELLNQKSLFIYELGNIYLKENNAAKAVNTYLQLLKDNPANSKNVQNILTNHLDNEDLKIALETQLYTLIQKRPNVEAYPEMLIWLFAHQNDYEQALIQAKALDKRNNEDGSRIMELANNASQEKQYAAAIDAYNYIISQKDDEGLKKTALAKLISVKQQRVTAKADYQTTDINQLESDYVSYLENYGYTVENVHVMADYALLKAYYSYDIPQGISLLTKAINFPNIPKKTKNKLKLELGDLYVLADDVWEATLLYAQVDKDEKDSPLGEDARFRNAKLSYYKGEFEWSQAQLKILKGATTELIANNALELSIFIMDNLGLDTTTATMKAFADADLLFLQNKYDDALILLDRIQQEYPGHALSDDIYLKKAEIYIAKNKYTNAVEMLNAILMNHGDDILADNAAFLLADLYENYLNDKDKAMEKYKLILTDYSDSVLLVEARKRYRMLRGDNI